MTFELTSDFRLYAAIAALCVLLLPVLVLRSTKVRGRKMRLLLLLLRGVCLLVLLFILADPVHQEPVARVGQCRTVCLVDTSESMGIGAPRSRLDSVARELGSTLAAAGIPVAEFDRALRLPGAGEEPEPSFPSSASGDVTFLGRALVRLIESTRDLGLANVVVCSDGRVHDRETLREAVRLATRHGVAVSAFVARDETPAVNVAIQNCITERHAPPGSRVPVRVLLRGENVAGRQTKLHLRNQDGRVLEEAVWQAVDGVCERELTLSLGNRSEDYVIEVIPLPGEAAVDDNRFEFHMEVCDPKIRVLYMEGSNHKDERWKKLEYEFLREAFLETGNIEVDVLTVDEQLASGGRLYRVDDMDKGYPDTRDELFGYDVVICSDINRFIFTPEQMQWTAELVSERGGGFCMIGGYTAFGAGGWDKTLWEKMIPMDMQTLDEGYVTEDFVPAFPDEARRHPILELDAERTRNGRILEAHPHFKGTNLVNRAKPGATVLALHPDRDMPVISVQSYGKGRSMAFTSDAAGGWGDYYQTEWGESSGDNCHYRKFWVNAVRWLAENSVARRRTELVGNTEAVSYAPGQVIKLRARILKPVADDDLALAQVLARLDREGAKPVRLRLDGDKREFRGELTLSEGVQEMEAAVLFTATDQDGQPIGEDRVAIQVLHIDREFVQVTPDPELLEQLARTTGGMVVQDAAQLENLLQRSAADVEEREDLYKVPLWDQAWLWGLVLLLFCSEWLIRKLVRFA